MNKKQHNDYVMLAIVGIAALSAMAIFGIYVSPAPNAASQNNNLVPIGTTGSVVNATVIYTKPNQTGITNFLDSVNSPVGGAPKLILQASSILFDSNQTQFPFSTYFNVPLQTQSLTDSAGHSLDLGSVQVLLTVGTTSQQTVVLTGEMQAFLDTTMVSDQQIYAQGVATGNSLPITIGGQKAFTFTFADEGKTWTDKSTHVFKIIITKIQATSGIGSNTNSFSTNSQFLAYLLPMTVDQSKITVIGYNQKAISIFQSDDTISTCGSYQGFTFQQYGQSSGSGGGTTVTTSGGVDAPNADVYSNGFVIASSGSASSANSYGNVNDPVLTHPQNGKFCTSPVSGIPRNADVTIVVGNARFDVHTPVTQYSYIYDCSTGTCKNNFAG